LGRTDRDNTNSGSAFVTFTHSADCHDPVCPEPHGVWSTTSPVTRNEVDAARPFLEAAAHRGETVCWVGSHKWVWAAFGSEMSRPAIDAEVLGRAIREHRQAEFDPHAVISMTHLCFDDCAENIAARYDELASR
jgi:hypothetical protein